MTDPVLRRKEYTEGKDRCVLKVYGGLHMIRGNRAPYFTITADLYENGRWASGGCQHELILRHYPELADLAAMHLSDINGTPSHDAANAWYWLAGCYPDAFGERYHGGNSEQNFPITPPADKPWQTTEHRKPTGDECLDIFARHVRTDLATARKLRDEIEAEAMAARHSRNAVAKAALARWVEEQRPRWAQEAKDCIAKHGLVVYGDRWEPRAPEAA